MSLNNLIIISLLILFNLFFYKYFLIALNKKLRDNEWFKKNNIEEPNILNLLDLVSLGTVCDVVPLIGLNRAIVKQGLKIIKNRSNLGLKTLYDLCKIQSHPTTHLLNVYPILFFYFLYKYNLITV